MLNRLKAKIAPYMLRLAILARPRETERLILFGALRSVFSETETNKWVLYMEKHHRKGK